MKVRNFFSLLVFASFALLFANCGDNSSNSADTDNDEVEEATTAGPSVAFLAPADGDTVSTTFTVKMDVQGMEIKPAGELVENTGHHHIIIDGDFIEKGTVVPADSTHIHFGKGQTETELNLAPGSHKLTLQFADGLHQSYGEEMSSTIKVTVKGDSN